MYRYSLYSNVHCKIINFSNFHFRIVSLISIIRLLLDSGIILNSPTVLLHIRTVNNVYKQNNILFKIRKFTINLFF